MADLIDSAGAKARTLSEGRVTPHRSCGICIAETFGQPSQAFQALRRGGLTGEGQCGAILGWQLVLGVLLGDPSPTGAVTPELRAAIQVYQRSWRTRLGLSATDSIVCNDLTRPAGDFAGPQRAALCLGLVGAAAEAVQEALMDQSAGVDIAPIEGLAP